ncbi:MAG: hypothetical protein ACYTX0_34110 [Nostoc sp.]
MDLIPFRYWQWRLVERWRLSLNLSSLNGTQDPQLTTDDIPTPGEFRIYQTS